MSLREKPAAAVVCFGCAAFQRSVARGDDVAQNFAYAVRCECGGIPPVVYREMRIELNAREIERGTR